METRNYLAFKHCINLSLVLCWGLKGHLNIHRVDDVWNAVRRNHKQEGQKTMGECGHRYLVQ